MLHLFIFADVATRPRQDESFDTTPIMRTFSTSGPVEQDLQDLIDVLSKDANHPSRVLNTLSAGQNWNRLDCQASTKQWPAFQTMKLENSSPDSVVEPWQWCQQDNQLQVQQQHHQHQSQMQQDHQQQLLQQTIDFNFINKVPFFDCSVFEKPFHPQTPPANVSDSFHIQQLQGENNFENQYTCTQRFAHPTLLPRSISTSDLLSQLPDSPTIQGSTATQMPRRIPHSTTDSPQMAAPR